MQTFTCNLSKKLRIYRNITKIIKFAFMSSTVKSGLARIELRENVGPFELFTEWIDEFKKYSGAQSSSFNLATASTSGEVANCTISLVERQKRENPNVAACFFWYYSKNEDRITRQVRIQGTAEELSKEDCENIYQDLPTFCKIRDTICEQGKEVDWENLKMRHDELLKKYEQGMELKMPKTLVAYKIIPKVFDFYYSRNSEIADRILFKNECCKWKHKRVCA